MLVRPRFTFEQAVNKHRIADDNRHSDQADNAHDLQGI